MVKASEGELRLAGVSLEADLEPDLPLVIANPVQLRQIVSNLVDNAIEAMRPVTGRRRVLRVTSRRQDCGELGLTPDGRADGEQSRRATMALAEENDTRLRRDGHEPSDGDLYLAHFLAAQAPAAC